MEQQRARIGGNLDRRLMLPMEEGNWMRALEVMHSRGGKGGLRPDHYEQLIRSVVTDLTKKGYGPSGKSTEPHGVIELVRSMACADSIPNSRGLFLSIIQAYCALGMVTQALEAAGELESRWGWGDASEGRRRLTGLNILQSAVLKSDARLVSDVITRFDLKEFQASAGTDIRSAKAAAVEAIMNKPVRGDGPDAQATGDVRELVRTAAMVSGSWERALGAAGGDPDAIYSTLLQRDTTFPAQRRAVKAVVLTALSAFNDGQWVIGLRCVDATLRRLRQSGIPNDKQPVPKTDLHRFELFTAVESVLHYGLHALGERGRWMDALALTNDFGTASGFLDATSTDLVASAFPSAAANEDDQSCSLADKVVCRAFFEWSFALREFSVGRRAAAVFAAALLRQSVLDPSSRSWEAALAQCKLHLSSPRPVRDATHEMLVRTAKEIGQHRPQCLAVIESLPALQTGRRPSRSDFSARWSSFHALAATGSGESSTAVRPGLSHYRRPSKQATGQPFLLSRYFPTEMSPAVAADPFRTPTAAPVGELNMASGYAYYFGVGGQPMPSTNRKSISQLNENPKRLRRWGDPNRSWEQSTVHHYIPKASRYRHGTSL